MAETICSYLNCTEESKEFLNGKCSEHYIGNKDCKACKGENSRCTTCAFTCINCLGKHWITYYDGLCNICNIWKVVGRKDMLIKRRARVFKDNADIGIIVNTIYRETVNTNGFSQDIKGYVTQDTNGRIVLTFTLLKN